MTAALQIHAAALATALAALLPAGLAAQDQGSPVPYQVGFVSSKRGDDVEEWILSGGVRYVDAETGLDIRCDRALLVLDAQQTGTTLRALDREVGLPRRSPRPPDARRALGEAAVRARLDDFLTALRRRPLTGSAASPDVELFRSIYLEGDVSVIQGGVEVLRADSLLYSPLDDRAVFRGVLLRLRDVDPSGNPVQVTVRTDELTRQKGRFVGRDVSVTTCPAGEPQFEVLSGEVEIVERADAFEIRARDNVLAFSRTGVLPLPDQSYVTGSQTNLPIRSASAGYSNRLGYQANVVVGGAFNDVGGAVHEALSGRPREEFRGDWRLDAGWIEARGFPLEGTFDYRGGDLYEGETLGFFLDDQGEDIRTIRNNLDGSPIDQTGRRAIWSENRIRLGERTDLDLTVFDASDPAVWAEFYPYRHETAERPETSIHARHADENWIVTGTGRFNLTTFSYADGRQLDTRFVEERPYLTFDWYSEPIAELPGETPLTLTSSTGIAQLRSNFDSTFQTPIDDETWRLDQLVELAAPFHVGPFGVRPYADARFTHYDNTVAGGTAERWVLGTGVELGTRMARTWNWFDADGSSSAIRHVLSPTVRFERRVEVEGDPSDYYQFDEVDAIDGGASIRVGLLQRFQRREAGPDGASDAEELVWFDLAQNFTPISGSGNGGNHLGLLEFEFILRPQRISENVRVGIGTEGEHDWNEDRLRTFNNQLEIQTADVSWFGQYRADRSARGQVLYGLGVPLRQRWRVDGFGTYDLDTSEYVGTTTQLVRNDLNWRFSVAVTYDAVSDDTSLRVLFEPTLGGLVRPRGLTSALNDPFVRAGSLGY